MRMAPTALAMAMTMVTAYVLYAESIDTRRIHAEVRNQERQHEQLTGEIASLKARRAELARPARIEPAARALGMQPGAGTSWVALKDVLPADASTTPSLMTR